MIHLCVTTFNRQDLLGAMLRSAFAGTVVPDTLTIIDQVDRPDLIRAALPVPLLAPVSIVSLGSKRGCEASAVNYFLQHIREERVIAHEDVVFGHESLAKFVATAGDFVIDDQLGVMTYRDRCRELVGLYDPEISPNYFRYVDVDYEDRLARVGIEPVVAYCGIQHLCNGTMKGYTDLSEYNRKVEIAAANYERKRGTLTPGGNTIGRSQWRASQQVTA